MFTISISFMLLGRLGGLHHLLSLFEVRMLYGLVSVAKSKVRENPENE